MTTNAIDRKKLIVSSDSRWSIPLPNARNPTHVVYIDDVGFDKISTSDYATLVFAGDGVLITEWKKWFRVDDPDWDAMPDTERQDGTGYRCISICVIEADGTVLFDFGQCLLHGEHARFAGSGATYARDCFGRNGCSIQSIDTAGKTDPYTGGTTMYLELSTGVNNLSKNERTLQDAGLELNDRGYIMDLANNVVKPLKEANKTQSEALKALEAGAFGFSAPMGQADRKWTDEERQALKNALMQAHKRKRETNRK